MSVSLELPVMLKQTGLFTYRKKGQLPTGEKITLLKVGGRTSAVVPSLQKKTGAVAGETDANNTIAPTERGVKDDEKPIKESQKQSGVGKKRKGDDSLSNITTTKEAKTQKKENVNPTAVTSRRRSSRRTDNY
jgi:formamidopyrimidine-DNA glycosylase